MGLRWQPATGRFINFFTDSWIKPNSTIRSLLQGPLLPEESEANVVKFRTSEIWDFSALSIDLPPGVVSQIQQVYFPRFASTFDRITWGLTNSGLFSVKTCMSALASFNNPSSTVTSQTNHHPNFNWIWRLPIPPKIKHFLWLLNHDRTPTAAYLHHIRVIDSPTCRLCDCSTAETNAHIFLFCPKVTSLWDYIQIKNEAHSLTDPSLAPTQWLQRFIRLRVPAISNRLGLIPSSVFLCFCLWSIWTARTELLLHCL